MSNKGISFLPFISLCNGLYEYLDQFKWIANGQDIWFELTYKIDLNIKTPLDFMENIVMKLGEAVHLSVSLTFMTKMTIT